MSIGILVPIIAVSIPLVAVTGRVIVQPIVLALSRRADARGAQPSEDRLARMEAQLALMEQTVTRLGEAQEFHARLLERAPQPPAETR